MKRTSSLGAVVACAGLLYTAFSPLWAAAPALFEVQIEIKTPSGEDLGKRRITTPADVEAMLEWVQGLAMMKLAVLVKRAPDPDCQQVSLRLERRETAQSATETNAKVVACGDQPVRFDGDELGAPAMTITLKRLGA
jgi:hypothetical protein